MPKTVWKPGTMLYPVPAVLVTSRYEEKDNIITVSWAGTVCTEPPMLSISLRPERLSYMMIRGSGEFVVNLPVETIARAVDFCGVKSGREVDKFAGCALTRARAHRVSAPLIAECPVSIECRVSRMIELGSHHMFIADVLAVNVDERLIDKKGKLRLEDARLLCYSHGQYFSVFRPLEKFGFSVRRKKRAGPPRRKAR
jgi:flavin reductase (DIM6/NTAB) family NADH-FMN oxidoreductase RutF